MFIKIFFTACRIVANITKITRWDFLGFSGKHMYILSLTQKSLNTLAPKNIKNHAARISMKKT